jgi:ribokinase
MAKIVVVGSLNMDIVAVAPRLPLAGETLIGLEYVNLPGGKGANQAYAAAKLGGSVAMLGRVGSDDHGQVMRANLASVGCDVDRVRAVEGSSGVAVIFVAKTGENSIVVVPGANDLYSPNDLRADAEFLSRTEFVLLQLETPLPTVVAAAQASKKVGARVILDPAPAPTSLPAELLQNVDIITPNETEAARLTGSVAGKLSPSEAREMAQRLGALGPSTVIIKLGEQGCLLSTAGRTCLVPAPRVEAIDSTAAGDVFNAAFAVARAEGASLVEACRFAVCAGALTVTRLGAQRSAPSRSELDSFLGVAAIEVVDI